MLDRELLDILVCPQCKGPLEHRVERETEELVCHACALRYEVRDDIPIMLIDEAKPL
ncbi:MAG TPA: Trm112 family protein [Longimicrobiales bacterium]|nr:Trm112 family protein [Longimicrobiales bacterium]